MPTLSKTPEAIESIPLARYNVARECAPTNRRLTRQSPQRCSLSVLNGTRARLERPKIEYE